MSASESRHYSVSELTGEIKSLLEDRFTKIYVEAEISGWRLYPSGHAYFTLKDEGAQISCVMFASSLARCKARAGLKDGAKVLVYANCTAYAPRGNYQLVVLAAKLAGVGDLMQRYLELKAKLEAEGLFDPAKKRPLPFMPRRIGIVTSEAGAVIHDMCTVMTRRFPAVEIRLFPALVQGDAAPATLIAGLDYFNSLCGSGKDSASPAESGGTTGDAESLPLRQWIPDLVIIARGGGSYEDLFCFNDESLVRAVAACRVPIISAVGHETDYTLCDFAADRRAGTPSIAAEIAVPVLAELKSQISDFSGRLANALQRRGEFFAQRLDHLSDSLASVLSLAATRAAQRIDRAAVRLEPAMRTACSRVESRLDNAAVRLEPAMRLAYSNAEARLVKASEKLTLLSPYGVLDRGYALVTDSAGAVVRDAAGVKPGDAVKVRLARGGIAAEVKNVI